jgi:hypothetical protein
MKLGLGHLFERAELIDTGVVDQDIEAAECLVGFDEEALDFGLSLAMNRS